MLKVVRADRSGQDIKENLMREERGELQNKVF